MTEPQVPNKTQAPDSILKLVARFEEHLDEYRSGQYNETQLRRDFLDPFWEALGWDIHNTRDYAEAYRDVIHEDEVKVGDATKAPDYGFRIGGARKFFLEAKKPSVVVKDDVFAAYQLRRYAWSAKLALSVLSDFEEFAIYDARVKPAPTDAASTARLFYCTFRDYAVNWDFIAGTFSRDAVLKGSFDRYADSKTKKRGTATVDDAFLDEIEGWRKELAQNLALRNEKLTQRELNFAVQRIIDRVIFLRICEDRGIEKYGRLRTLAEGEGAYSKLTKLFREADDRYNSGLFHFSVEKERGEEPDLLTPKLKVDDKVLRDIFRGLYYPQSPYEFSVISADMLGQVYERFLGNTIELSEGHRAKVVEKPEVRKAGGVYYTPTYIVDYIVKNTVGTLLEGKTPKQAAKLKVLDPACGSGSFLIGAYQHLLDWHLAWYIKDGALKHATGKKPVLYQTQGGGFALTLAERKRILLDNIHGVDIDSQAVEVTKLSLVLKVLEGETGQSVDSQLKLFHERALPDLGSNIKCGNSLIGPDFYAQKELGDFTEEERYRINVFDWEAEFPEIMKSGGFDAVIGNPPYVLLQTLDQRPVFDYLSKNYQTARYKIDTYHVFLERGLQLANNRGRLGFITPNTFMRNKHAIELRKLILRTSEVELMRVFLYPVFLDASVDTCITVVSKQKRPNPKHVVQIIRSTALETSSPPVKIAQSVWAEHPTNDFGLPGVPGSAQLAAKICGKGPTLGTIATAYFGIQTHDRKTYVSTKREGKHFKPAIDGTNINRYSLLAPVEYVDFRAEAIKSGGKQHVYERDRIGVRQIGETPVATLVPAGIYSLNTIYNVFFIKPTDLGIQYVLGVICSKAMAWYWRQTFFDNKETFPKVKKSALLSIPLPNRDFTDKSGKAAHDKMVSLVEQMLELHKQLPGARTPQEKTSLERQIAATDAQIDRLVYDLYGLTEDEIKIVEGS